MCQCLNLTRVKTVGFFRSNMKSPRLCPRLKQQRMGGGVAHRRHRTPSRPDRACCDRLRKRERERGVHDREALARQFPPVASTLGGARRASICTTDRKTPGRARNWRRAGDGAATVKHRPQHRQYRLRCGTRCCALQPVLDGWQPNDRRKNRCPSRLCP